MELGDSSNWDLGTLGPLGFAGEAPAQVASLCEFDATGLCFQILQRH